MNILIIYSKDQQEVLNRKSAIGSYIHTLANLLHQELKVNCYINGAIVEDLEADSAETNVAPIQQKSNLLGKLKSAVPSSIKQKISEKKLYKSHKILLSKLIRCDVECDHILEFYTLGSEVGYQLSKRWNVPLSIVYDSPVIEQEEFFKKVKVAYPDLITRNEKNTLESAFNLIVYSEPVKQFLLDKYSLANTNFIIRQNVDFSRLDNLTTAKDYTKGIHICFLGSFLKWHRVDLLIQVFNRLAEKYDNIYLDLIGDGMEFDQIRSIADESKFKDRISLPGFLDGTDLKAYKERMHIGIMPGSNWYGAPNKIFEYGAAGMAVVSCKSPTICDMFTSEQLSFFEMGNEEGLFAAIHDLIDAPDTIREKADVLKAFIQDQHNMQKTLIVYKSILGFE